MEGDFQVGEWLVQPQLNLLTRGDEVTRIEPKVMDVLVYLAQHTGDVLPKDRIIQAVWPDTFVTDDVLTHAVSELRKAFADDPHNPAVIQTLPKRGYRLVAPVEIAEEPAPHAAGPKVRRWGILRIAVIFSPCGRGRGRDALDHDCRISDHGTSV